MEGKAKQGAFYSSQAQVIHPQTQLPNVPEGWAKSLTAIAPSGMDKTGRTAQIFNASSIFLNICYVEGAILAVSP
jgi:hypothetical protein